MPDRTVHRRSLGRSGSGFTLVELLIVVAILAILVGLAAAVGAKVTQGGKKSNTESTIRMLDAAYGAWALDKQAKAPKVFTDETGVEFPIIDGRPKAYLKFPGAMASPPEHEMPALPSTSLFLLVAGQSFPIDKHFHGLDSKLIKRTSVYAAALASPSTELIAVKRAKPDPNWSPPAPADDPEQKADHLLGLAVKDAWGRPIRFVQSAYQGGFGQYYVPGNSSATTRTDLVVTKNSAQYLFRRSFRPYDVTDAAYGTAIGDADEGVCAGASPYFYSAGPDGDPGTRDDNPYAHKPSFAPETAKYNNN